MASRTFTVAFEGAEARLVDVQVQLAGGSQPIFSVVGLGDKTVAESRERVRAAFSALGLSMPSRRLIVNLAPADRPKEGSHFDLPIAIAILAEIGVVPKDVAEEHLAFGELGVDASINPTPGALPAAMAASSAGRTQGEHRVAHKGELFTREEETDMPAGMSGGEDHLGAKTTQLDDVAIGDFLINPGNAVDIIGRADNAGAGGGLDGFIAAGMIPVVMRVPDLGDRPAGRLGFAQDDFRVRRVDRGRLATVRVMDQIAVIIGKTCKLPDF